MNGAITCKKLVDQRLHFRVGRTSGCDEQNRYNGERDLPCHHGYNQRIRESEWVPTGFERYPLVTNACPLAGNGLRGTKTVARMDTETTDPLILERRTLLNDVTTALREAICAGEWTDRLPGERLLAKRMRVGRDTLRLALKQLDREGMISSPGAGRQRRVVFKGVAAERNVVASQGTIGFLTPHRFDRLPEPVLIEIDLLREQLAESNLRLEILNSSAFHAEQPEAALAKLVDRTTAACWVLHKLTAPMQRWFSDSGLPCVLAGQPLTGVELPAVDADFLSAGRHAGGFLLGRGHRRIAFLRPQEQLGGLDAAEKGLRLALTPHSAKNDVTPVVTTYVEDGQRDAVISKLSEIMRQEPRPTALVVTRSRQALTTLTWLATQGLRVPEDLSLITLDHSPYMEDVVPRLASYVRDTKQASKLLYRKIMELRSAGSTTRPMQTIMLDFYAGESVAKLR